MKGEAEERRGPTWSGVQERVSREKWSPEDALPDCSIREMRAPDRQLLMQEL